jgi:hypothetical protein
VTQSTLSPWSITFWPTATYRIEAKNVTLLFHDDLNHQRPSGRLLHPLDSAKTSVRVC